MCWRKYKIKTTHGVLIAFLDLPSSGTLDARVFESQGCVWTERFEELYDIKATDRSTSHDGVMVIFE